MDPDLIARALAYLYSRQLRIVLGPYDELALQLSPTAEASVIAAIAKDLRGQLPDDVPLGDPPPSKPTAPAAMAA